MIRLKFYDNVIKKEKGIMIPIYSKKVPHKTKAELKAQKEKNKAVQQKKAAETRSDSDEEAALEDYRKQAEDKAVARGRVECQIKNINSRESSRPTKIAKNIQL